MNLEDVILRDTRANQPAATAVATGTLYYVTDEEVTERSNGTTWQDFTDMASAVSGINELTGDVTAGPGIGAQAATIALLAVTEGKIANDAVTYAKLQNISATARILGRKTAAAGNTEECTLSEILDFIGSAAQGDILYRDAAGWARLAAGDSGKFLKTQGAAANPMWDTASGSGDLIKVRRAIIEAELETLNSAPVQLVAAPGADKIIVPVYFAFELDITVVYSNNPTYNLVYNGSTTSLISSSATCASTSTGKKIGVSSNTNNGNLYSYGSFDPRDKALMLRSNADHTGTGTGTAVVNVLYAIITTT